MPANSFFAALSSDNPMAERAEKLMLYGWLVGAWTFEGNVYTADGARHAGAGEIHCAWVLEGRAIQNDRQAPAIRSRCAALSSVWPRPLMPKPKFAVTRSLMTSPMLAEIFSTWGR